MWCSWRTVSAPSGASRYQPLIGAEQATSLAGGLDSEEQDSDAYGESSVFGLVKSVMGELFYR